MSFTISSKFLLLLSLFILETPQYSSQFEGFSTLSALYNRRLLQSTVFPTLKLCDTDVCEAQRPDGVCDRWSLGSTCPERQVYHIRGDPGSNDKAEIYLTLRSPWNITCSYGRCSDAQGAVYDVFVSEGCIPERDYISEMQDTSDRTAKQVKIYLRRSGSFYLTVQRRAGMAGASNCSFGLTAGSIEAADSSAQCNGFRRMSQADVDASGLPMCSAVMPRYNGFESSGSSTQATFIGVLVGVGLLILAICVLGSVLLRRWRRKLKRMTRKGSKDDAMQGVLPAQPDDGQTGPATMEAGRAGAEPHGAGEMQAAEVGWGGAGGSPGGRGQRLSVLGDDLDDEEGEEGAALGAAAGVLDPAPRMVRQGMGGSGSGLVLNAGKGSRQGSEVGGASPKSSGGSRGSSRGAMRTPSPADSLYRSRLTGPRLGSFTGGTVEGAGSRGPTPPEGQKRAQVPIIAVTGAPEIRRPPTQASLPSSAGDVDDLELRLKSPGKSEAGEGEGGWEDGTGIRIDDILSQAAAASGADKARAWKAGQPLDGKGSDNSRSSGSSGARSGASIEDPAARKPPRVPTPPDGSKPPPPPAAGGRGRPTVAPLMAARLGLTAGRGKRMVATGGRQMEALGAAGGGAEAPGLDRQTSSKAVALASLQNIPRASQPGVPPPPPRPAGMHSNNAANLGSLRLAQLQSSSSPGGRAREPSGLSPTAPPPPRDPSGLSPSSGAAAGIGAGARNGAAGGNGAARDGRGMSKLGGSGDDDLGGGGPV